MNEIEITRHAIERFVERSKKLGHGEPKNPQKIILRLLQKAIPCEIDPIHKVKRLINHNGEARYLTYQGWRFVMDENGEKLLTVEREKHEQN